MFSLYHLPQGFASHFETIGRLPVEVDVTPVVVVEVVVPAGSEAKS
jgi:hypothetical protein